MKKWRYGVFIIIVLGLLVMPVFSLENGKIVFSRAENNGNWKIYSINPDGTGQIRLTNNAFDDTNPAWSPDGTKIAFYSNRDGNYEIYVMNADGTGQTRLTNIQINEAERRISWSPDGSKIAFNAWGIYVMNVDGTGQTLLTSRGDIYPAWSPDGMKIAYSRMEFVNDNWAFHIYVMNVDGTGQTRITNNLIEDTYPAWSPDGTKIVFASGDKFSYPNGGWYIEVYIMNPDGTGQTRLTNDYNWDGYPAWSPDGTKIAYTRSASGTNNADIYVMNPDGTGQTLLTNPPGLNEWALNGWPSWGPAVTIPKPGSLEVKSSPSHAKIYINGIDTGKFAKWTFDDMAPGEYDVYVMLEGYETPETEHVTVMSEQTARLHFHLKKGGTPVPEFPSTLLPAAMIIGFLGAVIFIQKIKER